jgi:hypothetical protein
MTRTRTSVHNRIASIAIFAALAGTFTQVQAQAAFVSLDVPARPAAAAEMEQQANDLLVAGRGMERAAGLYARAAELRGASDERSADNLKLAGYLQFYHGRREAAVASLTQAGEAFLALGDVEQAAEAFIDAAWVACEVRLPLEARALAERGRLLTRSPLLEDSERAALLRRLGGTAGLE